MAPMLDIRVARGVTDMDATRSMFTEYQEFLGVDLCFQGFSQELADLPGCYAPPEGEIFLACDREDVAGIVAVRPVGQEPRLRCEMKRLYVRDRWRGCGLGRRLAELSLSFASSTGYGIMVLDTLGHLDAALGLYDDLGFIETAPYYENPLPGVVYMEKQL